MSHPHIVIIVYILSMVIPSTHTDVRVPPTITTDLPSRQLFRESGTVTMPCQASGTPEPEYEWKKDGVLLHFDNTIRMSPTSGDLTISDLRWSHEGYYQCFAHNVHGTSISRVSLLAMAKYANTDNTEVEQVAEVGKPLRIECRRISLSRPEPQFSWSASINKVDLSPVPLSTSKRMQITEQGHLYITNVIRGDDLNGKLYKCNLRNPFLDLEQGGSYTRVITVENGPVEETAPIPLHYPTSPVIALVGQELKLKCLFGGNPTPTVNWGRVNGVLPAGRYKTQQYATELVIRNIGKQDEGTYKCWGTNRPYGQPAISEEMMIEVVVEESPVFASISKRPHNKNATEGDDFTFFCEAEAKPTATVQWLINGEQLNHQDPGPRRSVGPDGTTLTIRSVYKSGPQGQSDLMVVQCNSSNVHGYIFASGYLNIIEQTKLIDVPSDVALDEESTHARFNCSATSDSSTPVTLSWWKDGQRLYPDEDQRLTLEESGSLFIDFQDMTLEQINEKYVGMYECQATNGYEPIAKAPAELSISVEVVPESIVAASLGDLWWVFVIAAGVLLFIILLLCCCVCCQRSKGQSYPVDAKERLTGNDPEKELIENGFLDYQRPAEATPIKGSRMSLLTSTFGDDDDDAWMEEYAGDFNPGNFEEDGSFIGQYDAEQRKRAAENHYDA